MTENLGLREDNESLLNSSLSLNSLKDLDHATTVDAFLDHFLGILTGLSRDTFQPLLGVQYEEPTEEDFQRVKKLFRKEIPVVFEMARTGHFDLDEVLGKLSESRRKMLMSVDSLLEKTFTYGKASDIHQAEVLVKDEAARDNAGGSAVKNEEEGRRGRKRRLPLSSDDAHPQSKGGDAAANSKSSISEEGSVILQGVSLSEDWSSPLKHRRSTGYATHYKGSDIVVTLLADMSTVKDEILQVDDILTSLQCTIDSQIKPQNIFNLILDRAEVGHNADNSLQQLDSLNHISRTVFKLSHEYLRMYQHGIDTFDNQRMTLARESADRYRRRWEGLQSFAHSHGKLVLSDISVACDRVPNPFGNFSTDYNSWTWLRDIYDANNPAENSRVASPVDFVSCEVRDLQEIASRLLDTILSNSTERPLSFFETVRRCAGLLAQGMNCVIIDNYSDASSNVSKQLQRVEAAAHRALIVSTVLSVFNGGLRPQRRRDLGSFVEKLRANFSRSTSASSAGSVNGGGHNGVTGVDRAWGPIMIVTKLGDIDAWEAGCREIFKDFNLDILPYLGSDSDRIACRAYLRALSTTSGGLNTVGSGLYCDRSHCHVLLLNYETLFLDAHFFKDVSWFAVVFDEPWGFVSCEKFHFARNQIFSALKTRHRILSCSFLASNYHIPANSSTTGTDVDKESMAERATYQLPDLLAVTTILCPYALGLGFSHDPDQVFCTHHLQHLPNQRFFPVATSFNNFNHRKPSGLPIRSPHNVEWIEVDGTTTYYLARLLATCTAVCSNSMLPYSSIAENITNPAIFDAVFQVNEQLHKLMPLLSWYGAELHFTNECSDEAVASFMKQNQTVHRITIGDTEVDNFHLFLTMKDYAYNILYQDNDLTEETQYVNLKVVGVTGTGIHRILVPETLKITESGEEVREFVYEKPKGISGRPRGKSRTRKSNADSNVAVEEPTSKPAVEQEEDAIATSQPDITTAPSVKQEATTMPATASSPVGMSAEEEERDDSDGDSDVEDESATLTRDDVTDAVTNEVLSTNCPPPRKRARIAAKPPHEHVDTKMDVEENDDGKDGDDDAKNELQNSMIKEEMATPAKVGATNANSTSDSFIANPDTPAAIDDAAFQDEMNKSITRRAGFLFVSILQQARHRFLGVFSSEAEAQAVYKAAYLQREELGLALSAQAQLSTPGTAGATSSATPGATSTIIIPRFKGRLGRDMKRSDGSFISEEYHRSLSEEDVYADLKNMTQAGKAIDRHPSAWNNVYNDAPSFGMFYAAENTDLFEEHQIHDTPISLYIPFTTLILGQAEASVIQSFMTNHLFENVSAASGFIFDYQFPAIIHRHLSSGQVGDFPDHRVPVMHVAQDSSIAKYHAFVEYNPDLQVCEISSLHPEAAVYLDGLPVRFGAAPQPIVRKSIVQLGRRSFIFCPPCPIQIPEAIRLLPAESQVPPVFQVDAMLLREKLVRLLKEMRSQWRRGGLPAEAHVRLASSQRTNSDGELIEDDDVPGVGEHIIDDEIPLDWDDDDTILKALENAEFRAIKHILQSEVERESEVRTQALQRILHSQSK